MEFIGEYVSSMTELFGFDNSVTLLLFALVCMGVYKICMK